MFLVLDNSTDSGGIHRDMNGDFNNVGSFGGKTFNVLVKHLTWTHIEQQYIIIEFIVNLRI